MSISSGVELTSNSIRAVIIEAARSKVKQRSAVKVKLLASCEIPCDTSQSEPLTQALRKLQRTIRLRSPVVLGVPSATTMLMTVNPLIVNPGRSMLAVKFELQQQLPFGLEEAAWHYHWLASNLKTEPRASHSVAVAMRRSLLDERLACFRRSGVILDAVSVNSIAALNLLSTQREVMSDESGMLLYVIDQQSAEWIFWRSSGLEVVSVSDPSNETLAMRLAASLEALRAHNPNLPATVRTIGSSQELSRLQVIIASQIPSMRFESFDIAHMIADGLARLEHPQHLSVALALALQGLGQARIPINFLAYAQQEKRARRIKRITATLSFILVLTIIVIGLSAAIELHSRGVLSLQSLERKERLYQTLRPEIRSQLQYQQHVERRTQQLAHLSKNSVLLTQLLSQVSAQLPDTVWLTKFECSKTFLPIPIQKLEGTGQSAGASDQTEIIDGLLDGRAKSFQDLAQFMERLKTTAGMTTVKLLSNNITLDEVSGKELIAFSIQIQRVIQAQAL